MVGGTNNVLDVLSWAERNGEAKIVDRILVKIMPQLLKNNLQLTSVSLKQMDSLEVSHELYELIKKTAEDTVGQSYTAQGA